MLDYNSPTIVEDLVKEVKNAGGEFVGALDAIATEETVRAVVKEVGSGKVVTNLPFPVSGIPDGVEVVAVNDTSYIGEREEIGGPIWGRFIPGALKTGVPKPVPGRLVIGRGLLC
ncbi:hypothetical protein ASPWEDRAFT_44675 [Aspergillus wentii DTO 134E9]|uniref:Alcohol dehydrogenase-like C-terminal domain-containing protein n=1 Tax=Aspergillus wentii DTO 134E9 TaxID=1073089 RepID=A0A1L9RC80_ASPWE|nr:uncharacterized protein ASPWEDRAFT_44675 [Aspergillus wentii DTO 134E9]KAI9935085.1 hypothetical protein MW887_000706 [Aspergillus wentii]OJJ32526.1 hypothetical protein ASPWEDRAFT_44675 [Aspergillus wentii DTO 134E9]